MSYVFDLLDQEEKRDELIADAVAHILDDVALPVTLLAQLDEHGVNLNWLFKEAASTLADNDESNFQGALT